MRSMLPAALLAASCLATGNAAFGQADDPFRVRNLNPPVAVFGLPTWDRVPDVRAFGVTMELANHYRLSARGSDVLILDGETLRTTFSYEHAFGDGWSIGAEVPFYRQSGGVLDDLIDGWHSTLSLPDGGRNNRPEDELLFQLARGAQAFFELRDSGSGVGDAKLSVARRIGSERQFVVRGSVKLATGKESILAGSGSTDLALTLLRTRSAQLKNRQAGYYWGVGALALGDPDRIRFDSHAAGFVGLIGGGVGIGPRFGFKAQIDVHSALYDSPLGEIGQTAVQATIGGWWQLRAATLDFAVVEDLHVSTVPDVVLTMGLRWSR